MKSSSFARPVNTFSSKSGSRSIDIAAESRTNTDDDSNTSTDMKNITQYQSSRRKKELMVHVKNDEKLGV